MKFNACGGFDASELDSGAHMSTLPKNWESERNACIAVLHFFITNARKFDIDDSTLSKELLQLGLPKERSDALGTP
ncbi:hypothetical protein R1flu_017895 [Riccia fluitans]|uniref:Uncharacterized protein n=1 Tax=Riccia fluitans TaxID=41844 RepID=A0ABD1ZEH6_9MARC